MPVITTNIIGKSEANPKPVTGVNYAGEPMKPGDYYNGRSEHCAPDVANTQPARTPTRRAKRKGSAWTAEKRAAFAERMRNYWQQRKASSQPAT